MQITIKQVLEVFLSEQKEKLAPRTYKYHDEAIYWFENYMNGCGCNSLDDKAAEKFDKRGNNEIEFCEMFEPNIINDFHFSEFFGVLLSKENSLRTRYR